MLGVGPKAIEHRLRIGRLHRIFPGAYAVGAPNVARKGRYLAATISYGPNALLSHRSAGAHWEIRGYDGPIELTIAKQRRPREGLILHLSVLPFDEVTEHQGIPITTVPRTIFDLAAVIPIRQVEQAMNEVEGQRLYDPLSLQHLLNRYPRRRGTKTIRTILGDHSLAATVTDSPLEEDFLAFAVEYGLPRPETQVHIQVAGIWYRCDAVYRAHNLVVELDGRRFHDRAKNFETDRTRDRALLTAGWRVVRVTWRELHRNAEQLADDLRALIEIRAA